MAPRRRRARAPIAFAAACVAVAAAFAADPPPTGTPAPAPATLAPPPAARLTATQLRDRFEKIQKGLDKAQDATGGTDAGRVSLLLQRADELILEFESGSGLDTVIAALAASRAAAAQGDYGAARADLRRGRESLRSLSDYSVARPLEVAYRSADQALEDQDPQAFAAAIDRLEATVLPRYLHDRLADARTAIARARQAMVRRDMKTGRKEVDAARIALGRLDYASALSQARYACIIGAELAQQNAFLVAREQVQDALRQMTRALRRAPAADVDPLNEAQAAVNEVWRRLSKPQPGDPDKVARAADTLETLRQRLH
jgi:hypothetical protein